LPDTNSPDTSQRQLTILVAHGPNLNILGQREPAIYGRVTLDEITTQLTHRAHALGCSLTSLQSNHEGQLIDFLQAEAPTADAVVINPAGLTTTSVSLRDALSATGLPIVEVHISNIYARESFRHPSLMAPVCRGQISGLGWRGYLYALEALVALLREPAA